MAFKNLGTGFAPLVAGSVNASAIIAPTHGNINYLNTDITLDAHTHIAMFNVGELGGSEIAVVVDEAHSVSITEVTPFRSE